MTYQHYTVNHLTNFGNNSDVAYANSVEEMWSQAKRRNKQECGTKRARLDSYLCEFMWRQRNRNHDYFKNNNL